MSDLAAALGYAADARLMIITGDEFGQCHAANRGIIKALETGLLTSTTLMMPCPWVMEAVDYIRCHPDMDAGVHLSLAGSSKTGIRWRPLCSPSEVPGLYAPDGYVWRTGREMWQHASPREVKKECRAQIEKALALGIDITHLDPHDGLFVCDKFGEIYGELGKESGLPLRMPDQRKLEAKGCANLREDIAQKGVLMSDDWVGPKRPGEGLKECYLRRISEAPQGVMDFWIHPAVECEELKACYSDDRWQDRVEDLRLFTEDADIRRAIETENITLIGWRRMKATYMDARKRKKGWAHSSG